MPINPEPSMVKPEYAEIILIGTVDAENEFSELMVPYKLYKVTLPPVL